MNEVEAAKRFVQIGDMVIELRNQSELDRLFYHLWDKFNIENLPSSTDITNTFGNVTHYFYSREEYDAYLDRLSFLSGTGKKVETRNLGADYMIILAGVVQ